ncbi:FAD-dependent oxidoreductase [Nocardioides mangrovicus]|uniref:FAD-dependent oxidoreductase n=1 Tax=Nocardioides mangrovicus TaxID=2478913 RepID=A0A3L8P4U0_9ACTN|nr:FAD-dependent oxidoreductase [Nocardioides mangrovicus]RLV50017.1 FAD-dependent oxidoreductase [Nocardioides mangrovicus]
MAALPQRARIVVVGGGVIGTSVAYHLTQLGETDVVLLEQGRLSGGTTWHAAGLVGQLRASESGTRLVQYSVQLYAELEARTGLSAGYRQCGGVTVARTPERMTQLRRTAASADAYGLECELLTPDEAAQRYPVMRTDDLVGAIWLPGDGKANPTDLTTALAKGARTGGARIHEGVRVTGVRTERGRVTGVVTDQGDVECEVVVNCAGQWAAAVGAMANVTVPLHSAEHFYVVTEAIEGVHPDLPVLRDPDGYTYFKEEVGGLVVGGFEPQAKPWVSPYEIPYPFEFSLLGEDWEHFSILMNNALLRIPALETTGIRKFYNGPESFTPDNHFLLGPAPGLNGFYVGAGFNSVGIASAGGAGRALAEWVVAGEPTSDLLAVDLRRFARFNADVPWLRARVGEVLGLHYEVPWPNREMTTARPFRRSPVHHLHEADRAVFGSRMGWERVNVFAPEGEQPVIEYAWGKQNWLPWSAAEQTATRTGVCVFDQTSFSKYRVSGPDAVAALQWLCTADVDVPVGRAVYTGLLNARGTYESDLTVTRVAPEEFLLVSSAATTVRDLDHLRRHTPAGLDVRYDDITTSLAVFGVMGPHARDLLARLTDADLSDAGFAFGTSRELDLGHARVRATRITYVGELGWELYVPVELAVGVYQAFTAHDDVVRGGYYAIESLRLEKGYRAFGRELTPDFSPVEAGLLFACKLRTDVDFLGREALERLRAEGPARRLVSFVVDDPEAMLWGGELVLLDGEPVGQVTSAAWGATLGACVGLAYVRTPVAEAGYTVDVGGDVHPVSVSTKPLYDPASERVRGPANG